MLCIRFNVSGGEWRDNNHGSKYIANFGLKEIPIPPAPISPLAQPSQGYKSITKGTFGDDRGRTKDKNVKYGVRIKGPSKLPVEVMDSAQTLGGGGGGDQMKLPQKRMENRRLAFI
jgi:hypothetical protein